MTTYPQDNTFFEMAQEALTLLDALVTATGKYAQHGEGTIVAGASSATITHHLNTTPTSVNITPEDGFDAPYEVPRASIGATTFVVQYKGGVTQPVGTTAYFLWEVKP
jgi:hypothetical protein